MAHYTQCKMTNDTNHIHMAWIPSTFAKTGRHILIKTNEEWASWVVKETYATMDSKVAEERGHRSTKGFGSVVKE